MNRGCFTVGVIAVALLGFISLVVTLLWNELMPALFGLPHISMLQGLGLYMLGNFLFGGHAPKIEWKK